MAIWLNSEAPGFERDFAAFLTTKREASEDVNAAVKAIISEVVARGDAALKDYSLKFDALDFDRVPMRVTSEELDAALAGIDPKIREALELAAERI